MFNKSDLYVRLISVHQYIHPRSIQFALLFLTLLLILVGAQAGYACEISKPGCGGGY